MTTYYVSPTGSNSNNGLSTGAPWAGLVYAAGASSAGDTIKLMPGTYNQVLLIVKDNQTWTTEGAAHTAIIDGKYGPGPDSTYLTINANLTMEHPRLNRGKWLPALDAAPGYITAGLITVAAGATGVTISNLYIRRSAGSAIKAAPSCHQLTISNCKIDFTYAGAIQVGAEDIANPIEDFTIEDCIITRSSMRKLTGKARQCEGHRGDGKACVGLQNPAWPHDNRDWFDTGGADSVDVTIKPKDSLNAIIRGNTLAYCYGEGIAAAAGSQDILIEDNLIHNTYHWSIGVNCSKGVTIRRNQIFSINTLPIIKTASAGIVIGDEIKEYKKTGANNATRQRSENVSIYNNLVVGTTMGFSVRGYTAPGGASYVTRLKNTYVGFNTWIGRPYVNEETGTFSCVKLLQGAEPNADATAVTGPANHYSFLYENNVHLKNGARYVSSCANALGNFTARNNAFSETPDAVLNKTSNVTGATADSSVPQHDSEIWAYYDVRAVDCDPTQHSFDPANYHLVDGAACIGAGSDGSAASGVTPAVTDDYRELTRTSVYDIGWYEFGAGAGAAGVTINFTQKESPGGATVDGGTAPYSVYFDDTSTVSGVTINTRRWDFGDGDSYLAPDGAEFAHVYNDPGTYTAKLTIWDNNGRKYVKNGAAFTVTGDGGVTGAVYIATASAAIGTGAVDSTVDFSFGTDLNGLMPKLVIFTVTKATATGTAVGDAMLGHGFTAGKDKQWAAAMCSQDNQATTVAGRQHRADCCILTVDETGARTGSAEFYSFSANTATVKITDQFPASYLVTATAYAGDGVRVAAGNTVGPIVGASVELITNFTPDVLSVITTNAGGLAAPLTTAALCTGYATSAANQYCVRWHEAHGKTQGEPRLDLQPALAFRNTQAANIFLKLSQFTGTGATIITQGGDYNVPFGWYALEFATESDLRLVSTATATGNQDTTLGWQPGYLQGIVTLANANVASLTSSLAGSVGYYVLASGLERTNAITSQYSTDAADNTNTQSLIVASNLGIPLHTGGSTADALLGDGSFIATGYRINWATVQATARRVLMLAIETDAGAAPAGPVVSFTVTPTSGLAPLDVELADTSDGNGATISAWVIEWGDGTPDDTVLVRPTALAHTYQDAGTYTVAVTATNVNGSTTLTKTNYVTAQAEKPPQIIGPVFPITITEETENNVNLNPDDKERGQLTHKLELGALRISSDYTNGGERDLEVVDGRWQMAVVNGDLVVMDADGNLFKVKLETYNPVDPPPPPPNNGSLTIPVAIGNDDGDQAAGTVVLGDSDLVTTATTQYIAIRFQNVNLPSTATVTSAYLDVNFYNSSYSIPYNLTIKGNDIADADQLQTTASYISGLTTTTASVTWTDTSALGIGYKSSPDIKAVIQEIIGNAGWDDGGKNLMLIIQGTASSNFRPRSRDFGVSTAPVLRVNYTT